MRQSQFIALALIAAYAALSAMGGASFRASAEDAGTFNFCVDADGINVSGFGFTPGASLVIWTGWNGKVGTDSRVVTVSGSGFFTVLPRFPTSELPTIVEATDQVLTPVTGPVSVGASLPSCAIAPGPSVATSTVTPSVAQLPANGTSTSGITVQLEDSAGLTVPIGGETVTLSTTGGAFAGGCMSGCIAHDNGNGTYSATLTVSTTPGIATITGFLNGTPIVHMGIVQVLPLAPSLGGHPPSLSASSSATFTFSGLSGLTFQCSIDGGTYTPCSSPDVVTVADGMHTFSVEQVEPISHLAGPPTSFSWTVDTTPPAMPTVTGGPGASTSSRNATFSFSGESGATFTCSLDGGVTVPCTSGGSGATFSSLSLGQHTFRVFATDPAGNTGPPAVYNWMITTVPPAMPTITAGPGVSTVSTDATFVFTGAVGVTFTCSLDGGTFAPCTSGGNGATFTSLSLGPHTFRVFATDVTGNSGLATVFAWTVTGPGCNVEAEVQGNQTFAVAGVNGRKANVHVTVEGDCDQDPKSGRVFLHHASVKVQVDGGPALIDAKTNDVTAVMVNGSTATISGNYNGSPFTVILTDGGKEKKNDSIAVYYPGFPTPVPPGAPANDVHITLG